MAVQEADDAVWQETTWEKAVCKKEKEAKSEHLSRGTKAQHHVKALGLSFEGLLYMGASQVYSKAKSAL